MLHYAEELTDPAEIELWNEILAHQGETLITWIPGIQHYETLVSMPENR
jgi:hypothetical protein